MAKESIIEAVAPALWATDPRVNAVPWHKGNAKLKALYRNLAAAAVAIDPSAVATSLATSEDMATGDL